MSEKLDLEADLYQAEQAVLAAMAAGVGIVEAARRVEELKAALAPIIEEEAAALAMEDE